jgi:3-oxoacyl-[acyl-carrier-protein] synthase III
VIPEQGPVGAARIASVGVDLPRRRLSTADLMASCRYPVDADMERLTGIRERRVCAEDEDSYTLAIAAALDCLARSGCRADDVEMLVSCGIAKGCADLSYVYEPPMSVAIQRAIGAERAICFDVANACAGMVTGLAIVNDFIRRGAIRRGMVVSGEYISHIGRTATRHVTGYSSPQLPSLTLGDAGAAVLLERAHDGNGHGGIRACELVSFADHSDLCIAKPGEPDDELGWAMSTDALKLHLVAIDAAAPIIARALEASGGAVDSIDCVIPHQTTEHAIRIGTRRVLRALDAPHFAGEIVYNLDCGNTASTSHFLALHRCLLDRRIAAGQRVLLLSFASGVVVGAVLIDVDDDLVRLFARDH